MWMLIFDSPISQVTVIRLIHGQDHFFFIYNIMILCNLSIY